MKERDVCMCVYMKHKLNTRKEREIEREFATSGVARKFESNIALYTVVVEGGWLSPSPLSFTRTTPRRWRDGFVRGA